MKRKLCCNCKNWQRHPNCKNLGFCFEETKWTRYNESCKEGFSLDRSIIKYETEFLYGTSEVRE